MHSFYNNINNRINKIGELLAFRHIQSNGIEVAFVANNPQYFGSGADLIITEPGATTTIDVKTDQWIVKTGNVCVEFVENAPKDDSRFDEAHRFKKGWAYSKTDKIYAIAWKEEGDLEMYCMDRKRLLEVAFMAKRQGFTSLHHEPFPYFTFGVLVPVLEIKQEFETEIISQEERDKLSFPQDYMLPS